MTEFDCLFIYSYQSLIPSTFMIDEFPLDVFGALCVHFFLSVSIMFYLACDVIALTLVKLIINLSEKRSWSTLSMPTIYL